MARQTQVVLIDDVDGSEASETVQFGLDGVQYEIDLHEDHAAELREAVKKWADHARRAGGRKVSGRKASTSAPRRDLNEMREWGRQHGYTVSDRGRVSGELQQAFDEAHA